MEVVETGAQLHVGIWSDKAWELVLYQLPKQFSSTRESQNLCCFEVETSAPLVSLLKPGSLLNLLNCSFIEAGWELPSLQAWWFVLRRPG